MRPISLSTKSPWQRHVDQWSKCTRCPLAEERHHIVLARGVLPCQVLFIGEAPGSSEDVLGEPFVGPAGKRLDDWIQDSFPGHMELAEDGATEVWRPDLRYALTNLVACFPRQEKKSGVNEPPKEAILQCQDRLKEMVVLANPKLIVTVGKLADKWAPEAIENYQRGKPPLELKYKWASIVHPAWVLRRTEMQQSLDNQRAAVTLRTALREVFGI